MEVSVSEVREGKLLFEDIDGVFVEKGCGEAILGICDLERRKANGGGAVSEKLFGKL